MCLVLFLPNNPTVSRRLNAALGKYLSMGMTEPTNLCHEKSGNFNVGANIQHTDGRTITMDYYNM